MESEIKALAPSLKAWPFVQALKLCERIKHHPKPTSKPASKPTSKPTSKNEVIFETGYGPSGLPHIGTFGEVLRTTMVRHAFQHIMPEMKTRLICFSDDLDGLRKVPDNVPQKNMLKAHLDKPLTSCPDPYGKYESFGAHNNAKLKDFLDGFSFEYEFVSATDYYKAGYFDECLKNILQHYEEIASLVLQTLREERRKTYSPFLPICPLTGKVLMVPLLDYDTKTNMVSYRHPDTQKETQSSILGGACKLQWKVDWAMRWVAMGVDYEMAGKDLDESVKLSSRICKILGAKPPCGFSYELFLDEKGEKISKSKGNGIGLDEWLSYASPESLSYYMFLSPRKAKKLYFDVIPKNVDGYLDGLATYPTLSKKEQLESPIFHIHNAKPPKKSASVGFSLLLNLVSASHASDKETLWGFIKNYVPEANEKTDHLLDKMVGYALRYYKDFVAPHKHHRKPSKQERIALEELATSLDTIKEGESASNIQTLIYKVGKKHFDTQLRDWFQALYQILLGQSAGPRFGSFVALYGVERTKNLIIKALNEPF